MVKKLIVTHHAPDVDAIGSVWLLKRFDAQHYADAHVSFVDPGSQIDPSEAERLGFQMHQVVHVDTGLGEFDHHQPERGHEYICASSLVYNHICKIHPELVRDQSLKQVVSYITEIDHFGEIHWPEASSLRYCFMFHELLEGFEGVDPHDDDSQLQFGIHCFDCAYNSIKETLQAQEEVEKGTQFELPMGKCLGMETRNDHAIKFAQKAGYVVVVRKDPKTGEIRIKARPDFDIDLKAAHEAISKIDNIGSWYYHPSGKMLLNGSRKQRSQRPSPLTLPQVIEVLKSKYA
jgi:hypothetical protein